MTSPKLVSEHADLVQAIAAAGTGEAFSLTWRAGDSGEERARLIDHHQAVVDELCRRGRRVDAAVLRDEADAEHYVVRIVPDS